MEGAERASRQTDELRMKVYMRLLLSILCTRPMNEDLIKCLGLDLSMTYDGITPLNFISKDSLLKLKAACDTTKIEDLLQHLFMESEAVDVLKRGKVKFKMFMYMMSPEEYGHYSLIRGNLTEKREKKEEKMLNLFAEELDPNKLFEDLWNMNLVGENDKEEVMNHISRKARMDFLIGRLKRLTGNKMVNILLAHSIKHDHCYLWKKIIDIYGGDTGNSHLTGRSGEDKSIPGEKVFTADFTLSIQESALKVDIQNRKWHLDTDEAVMKEIVIMGIIPESTEENPVTTEAVMKEIVIMGIIPESTEENPVTTGKLHQTILNRCLPELVSDLNVTVVCMHVQQREVLDHVTVRDILEQKTTSDKTRELIKQIQERDHVTYEKFKECLVQAKQKCLKVMLEEEEAKYAKEIEEKRHLKRKRSMHDDDTDSSTPS